jgi:hypothetical protein
MNNDLYIYKWPWRPVTEESPPPTISFVGGSGNCYLITHLIDHLEYLQNVCAAHMYPKNHNKKKQIIFIVPHML